MSPLFSRSWSMSGLREGKDQRCSCGWTPCFNTIIVQKSTWASGPLSILKKKKQLLWATLISEPKRSRPEFSREPVTVALSAHWSSGSVACFAKVPQSGDFSLGLEHCPLKRPPHQHAACRLWDCHSYFFCIYMWWYQKVNATKSHIILWETLLLFPCWDKNLLCRSGCHELVIYLSWPWESWIIDVHHHSLL